MKFISYRGNLYGPNPKLENKPTYIIEALKMGFDLEVDVFFRNKKFYLGHDGTILTFENAHPKWSYAKCNKDGMVIEVAEKNIISKNATVGVY